MSISQNLLHENHIVAKNFILRSCFKILVPPGVNFQSLLHEIQLVAKILILRSCFKILLPPGVNLQNAPEAVAAVSHNVGIRTKPDFFLKCLQIFASKSRQL